MTLRPKLAWASLLLAGCVAAEPWPAGAASTDTGAAARCTERASPACIGDFVLPGGAGRMRYYHSALPAEAPHSALLVMHGHPRDANRSFDAGLLAARRAGRLSDTLVVAPIYQVPDAQAKDCRTSGVPAAQPGEAVWTCSSWLAGEPSLNEPAIGAFAALDALVVNLVRHWPRLRTITLAGFSAGAQMLQHDIGFAADPPTGVALRYVIADPGSWLYFGPERPRPQRAGQAADWSECGAAGSFPGDCTFTFERPRNMAACPAYDAWKLGVQSLPTILGRDAAAARTRYAAAEINVLVGALDSSDAKGTFYPILDKSCGAMLQGPYRLQRGVAYAAYDDAVLQPQRPRSFVVVPGCAHDVSCVLPSAEARPLLFPLQR